MSRMEATSSQLPLPQHAAAARRTKRLRTCAIIFPFLLWATMQMGADITYRPFGHERVLGLPMTPVLEDSYLIAPLLAAIGWMFTRRRFPILSTIAVYLLCSVVFAQVRQYEQRHLAAVQITRPLTAEEQQVLNARLKLPFIEQGGSKATEIIIENNPEYVRQLSKELETLHVRQISGQ
jgi:hypothetical protein